VDKILGMFREMVEASEAKEASLLEAKSQLYRVPDTIQNQVLIAPVTSPLRSETPRVKTPPTVVLSETDETQPYTPETQGTQPYSQKTQVQPSPKKKKNKCRFSSRSRGLTPFYNNE
jgi:hypothetical protein